MGSFGGASYFSARIRKSKSAPALICVVVSIVANFFGESRTKTKKRMISYVVANFFASSGSDAMEVVLGRLLRPGLENLPAQSLSHKKIVFSIKAGFFR